MPSCGCAHPIHHSSGPLLAAIQHVLFSLRLLFPSSISWTRRPLQREGLAVLLAVWAGWCRARRGAGWMGGAYAGRPLPGMSAVPTGRAVELTCPQQRLPVRSGPWLVTSPARAWQGDTQLPCPEGPTGRAWLLPAANVPPVAFCPSLAFVSGPTCTPTLQALSRGSQSGKTFVPCLTWQGPRRLSGWLASPRPSAQAPQGPSAQSCAPAPQASALDLQIRKRGLGRPGRVCCSTHLSPGHGRGVCSSRPWLLARAR